jgi:hypothetical protein
MVIDPNKKPIETDPGCPVGSGIQKRLGACLQVPHAFYGIGATLYE